MGEKVKKQVGKITTSKRFWITVAAFAVDSYLFNKGIEKGADLMALGIGITILNGPVAAYLGFESFKPSKKKTDAGLS